MECSANPCECNSDEVHSVPARQLMEYVIANEKRNRKEMAELKLLMKSRLMGEGNRLLHPVPTESAIRSLL